MWVDAQAQMFDTEPAFRHLQNAFSILNLAAWAPANPDYEVVYFRSINKVFELCRKGELVYQDEMVMFCCMIVGVCEFLRTADVKAAWPHRIAGLKILDDWSTTLHTLPEKHKSNRLRLMAVMRPAFICGGMTADSLMAHGDSASPLAHRDAAMSQIPPLFVSSISAAVSLENIIVFWLIPLLRPPSSWIKPLDPGKVVRLFDQWSDAYSFVACQQPASVEELTRRTLIEMHLATAQSCLRLVSGDPATRPNSDTDFEKILSPMRSLQPAVRHAQEASRPAPGIYQPLGLIAPAFFVAVHSDNPDMRREACALLRESHVNEGAWNSTVAVVLAEMLRPFSPIKKNPQELPSPPEAVSGYGQVRLKKADCRFRNEECATLRLVYERFDDCAWQSQSCELMVDDANTLKACKLAAWVMTSALLNPCRKRLTDSRQPLVATLQSWGYIGTNVFPSPYFHSINLIRDRLASVKVMQKPSSS